MKNLVFQYYIPYESFDADMGGIKLPEWAHAGSRSAKAYADYCGAEYELSHDRFFDQSHRNKHLGYISSQSFQSFSSTLLQ